MLPPGRGRHPGADIVAKAIGWWIRCVPGGRIGRPFGECRMIAQGVFALNYAPTTAAEVTARCAQVAIALVLFGCSTPASPWQRAGTSDDVMKADLAACETAAARSRNGGMGPIYDDYVTSCMLGLGYNLWR